MLLLLSTGIRLRNGQRGLPSAGASASRDLSARLKASRGPGSSVRPPRAGVGTGGGSFLAEGEGSCVGCGWGGNDGEGGGGAGEEAEKDEVGGGCVTSTPDHSGTLSPNTVV